jgi:hypothetical protein
MTVDAFSLHVTGQPFGKERPRFGNGHARTPPRTIVAEEAIRGEWSANGCPRLPDGAPVRLVIVNGIERPAGHYRRDGTLSAEGLRHPLPENKKPDLDNNAKLVMDALNKRAWKDDVQVVSLRADRIWADRAFTSVTATVISGGGGVHVLAGIGTSYG